MRPRQQHSSQSGCPAVIVPQPKRCNRGNRDSITPAAAVVPDANLLQQILAAMQQISTLGSAMPGMHNPVQSGLANLQFLQSSGQQHALPAPAPALPAPAPALNPLPLPALPAPPPREEPADESESDSMAKLEKMAGKPPMKTAKAEANGKSKAKAKAKATAEAEAKAKAKAKANASAIKRPAAVKRPAAIGFVLGCSRCRWSPLGCADSFKNGKLSVKGCRNPTFCGKRRTE